MAFGHLQDTVAAGRQVFIPAVGGPVGLISVGSLDLLIYGEYSAGDRIPQRVDLLHLRHGDLVPDSDGRHFRTGSLGHGNVLAAVPFRQVNGQDLVLAGRIVMDHDVTDDARVPRWHTHFRQGVPAGAEIDDGHQTVAVGCEGAAACTIGVSVLILELEHSARQCIPVPRLFDDFHTGTGVRDGDFPHVGIAARRLTLIVGGDIRIGLLRRLPRLQAVNRHGFIRLDGGDGRVGDRPVVAHARSGQHDLTNDIIREHAAILKMLKEVADRSRAVGQLTDGSGKQCGALQIDGHIDRIVGFHEGSVRPNLLDGKPPATLVMDLHPAVADLFDHAHVDGIAAGDLITGRAAAARAGGAIRVEPLIAYQLVARRYVIGFLRYSELGPGDQIPDLQGVSIGNIEHAGAGGSLQLCRRQVPSLKLAEVRDAERYIFVILQRAVVPGGVLHVVYLGFILHQRIAHIDTIGKLRVVVLRTGGIYRQGVTRLVAEHLLHGEIPQCRRVHMVLVSYPLPLTDAGRSGLEILECRVAVSAGRTGQNVAVGLDSVEDLGVHRTFLDIVFDGLVAAREGDLRRFSRLQEENVLIGNAVDRIGRGIGHRLTAALEVDVLPVGRVIQLLEQLKVTAVCRIPPEDLVGEGQTGISHLAGSGDLLGQLHGGLLHGGQVEAHMEVRSVGAPLHIEHRHFVARIVLENVISAGVELEYTILAD